MNIAQKDEKCMLCDEVTYVLCATTIDEEQEYLCRHCILDLFDDAVIERANRERRLIQRKKTICDMCGRRNYQVIDGKIYSCCLNTIPDNVLELIKSSISFTNVESPPKILQM